MVPASNTRQAVITFRYFQNFNTILDQETQLGMDFNNTANVTRQSTTIPNAMPEGLDGYRVYLMKSVAIPDLTGCTPSLKVTNTTTGTSTNYSGKPINSPQLPGALYVFDYNHKERLGTGTGDIEFEAVLFYATPNIFRYSPRCLFKFAAP